MSLPYKVIALHGLPGTGKDTVARHLGGSGYTRIAFADALYRMVAHHFGTTEEFLRRREVKDTPRDLLSLYNCTHVAYRAFMVEERREDVMSPRTSRYHLDHFGTTYMGDIDAHFWVRAALSQMENTQGDVVITDLRAYGDLREITGLKRYCATYGRQLCVVELTRDGAVRPSDNPIHERLPPYLIDATIHNEEGEEEQTARAVEDAAKDWFAQFARR